MAVIFLLPLVPLAARADTIPGPSITSPTWGTHRYETITEIHRSIAATTREVRFWIPQM